jgi:hypothetical protein
VVCGNGQALIDDQKKLVSFGDTRIRGGNSAYSLFSAQPAHLNFLL